MSDSAATSMSMILDDIGGFSNLVVYDYHDFPLTFTVEKNGRLFYFHYAFFDPKARTDGYLVRETTKDEFEKFKNGSMTIYEFLKTAPVLRKYVSGSVEEFYEVKFDDISNDNLPNKDIYFR